VSEKERKAYVKAVEEHLRSLVPVDAVLVAAYSKMAAQVRVTIEKAGDDVTVFQLNSRVQAVLDATRDSRSKVIEGAAKAAEKGGIKLGSTVDERAFSAAQVDATAETTKAASARIAKRVKVPSTTQLSKRIRKWDRELGGRVAREVERGIRQHDGILEAAKKIVKVDRVTERLPQYIEELESAARLGDGDAVRALSKKYAAQVRKRLGAIAADGSRSASPFSLRGPTQRLIQGLRKAQGKDVDAVVETYIKERGLWRARVIARTETVRAFRSSYVEHAAQRPGVVAIQWRLSNRHSIADECELYASQNLYDLGPGGYPPDAIPESHPNCLCTTTAVIDDKHFRRDTPEGKKLPKPWIDKKSPDGLGWLKKNPDKARAILGPTRHEMLKRGVNVLDKGGKPKPVGTLLRGAGRGKGAPAKARAKPRKA